jgi:uncharacterized protein (TIRG00374 family)
LKRGQLLLVIVLLLATLFLGTQFSRLEDYIRILLAGHPVWMGLGLFVLFGWQVTQAAQFRAAHRAAAVEQSLLSMLPVVAANNFVLIAVPTGSLSTFALFLAHARRQGASPERTAVAIAFLAVFQYLALAIAIGLALLALAAHGALYALEWVPALPIFALALGQYAVLLFAMRSPVRLERTVTWLADRVNRVSRRLVHRDLVSLERMHLIGANAAGGLDSMRQKGPRAQLGLLLYALVSQALLGVVLAVLLLAFGQHVSLTIVLAGLGMAILFTVVSPTPVGVGVVEGALAVVLASLGIAPGAAVIVSLAFRGVTLWLPVLYGFIALQALGFRAIKPDIDKSSL